jgi:pyruvate-ferredoxin/flavodoxin oxidoreductase
MRYNPALRKEGKNPFQLDSKAPSIPLKQYAYQEARYSMLARSDPETARNLLRIAQDDVNRNWQVYQNRATAPPDQSVTGESNGDAEPVEAAGAKPEDKY